MKILKLLFLIYSVFLNYSCESRHQEQNPNDSKVHIFKFPAEKFFNLSSSILCSKDKALQLDSRKLSSEQAVKQTKRSVKIKTSN